MDYDKLIERLRRRGLSNGSALGPHSGLYEEAATAIETLRADLARVTAERDAAKEAVKNMAEYIVCAGRVDYFLCDFTPDGKYIEWTGIYLYSDIPFEVTTPTIVIGGESSE